MFLRGYVDKLYYRSRPDRRKRRRIHDNLHFVRGERTAPPNAPHWTKSGYNGSMNEIITKAVSDKHESTKPTESQEIAQELALTNLDDEEESSETEEN